METIIKEDVLSKYICKIEKKEPQLNVAKDIIDLVNYYFNEEILTKCRKQTYTLPRQIAQYLIKYYCDKLSEIDIAILTGLKSHATVRNSIKKIEWFLDFDKEIKADVGFLMEQINEKVDLSSTNKSIAYKRNVMMDNVRSNMVILSDGKFFDLIDVINKQLNKNLWNQ